uniref:VHS domain-containing protein n=1 Tax=Spongospora subterranea TaxID=70186 RepID=A0A0H5RSA7_9EUKA|eukprot:CRZ11624.1 hypothetical protein [Spongospora subterranea]
MSRQRPGSDLPQLIQTLLHQFDRSSSDLLWAVKQGIIDYDHSSNEAIFNALILTLTNPLIHHADDNRGNDRPQWRALIVIEYLFLHVSDFRHIVLDRIDSFLCPALNGTDTIRQRALIILRRWIAKYGGDCSHKRLTLLSKHVRQSYNAVIPDDPRQIYRQELQTQVDGIENVFRSMTDLTSNTLLELSTTFDLLIPFISRDTVNIPSFNIPEQIDEFSGDSSDFSSDDETSLDSFSADYLEWGNHSGSSFTNPAPFDVGIAIRRDFSREETSDNLPLYAVVRDSYKVLMKRIRPELLRWKSVFEKAQRITKSSSGTMQLERHQLGVRYGITISFLNRVDEAIYRCEIILGLLDIAAVETPHHVADPKPVKAPELVEPKPPSNAAVVSSQTPAKRKNTAKSRIGRILKKKR